MPVQHCPACERQTSTHLHAVSKDAIVNYYRSVKCGHIWTIHKVNPSLVTHVTPLSK